MTATGNNILITIKNATLCYDDNGTGDTPLIFIHGFPFDRSMWLPQSTRLSKLHRVITYDLRGYGRSSTSEYNFSMTLFADDLIQLMDLLQIKKANVCGLSMGGYILLNAVNRYPERFKSLILADTQCINDTDEIRENRYKSIDLINNNGLDQFAEGFVSKIFTKNSLENNRELISKIKNVVRNTDPQVIISTLKALAERQERCTILNEIKIPVLVLCGDQDTVTPKLQSEKMLKLIPGSRMHTIPDAAHLSNLEQPEEFNSEIESFLKSGS
jgi:3-oxoadipate enol-lactonase